MIPDKYISADTIGDLVSLLVEMLKEHELNLIEGRIGKNVCGGYFMEFSSEETLLSQLKKIKSGERGSYVPWRYLDPIIAELEKNSGR